MIRSALFSVVVFVAMAMTSCSDYRDAIPGNSIALISFDAQGLSEMNGGDNRNVFNKMLGMDDIASSGIDFNERIYLFEERDGSLGLVASVDDVDKMESWFNGQAGKGKCTKVTEKKGYRFTVLNGSFVAGFSKTALVIMGPEVESARSRLQAKIIRNLDADGDKSIVKTKIYEKLSSMESPINMVVKGKALPEKLVSVFSFGVSSKASPDDIIIAASATVKGNCLNIVGETFSFDENINMSIKSSLASYHPISGDYLDVVSLDNVMTILSGVNGENYLNLLRNNYTFRTLLVGLNLAIDIDMMLKSIDGDIYMAIPTFKDSNIDFRMFANTCNTNWLDDVPYWKKTAPAGSKIESLGARDFHYRNSDWTMYFGINAKDQLYLSTTAPVPLSVPASGLPEDIKAEIRGKRACAILSLKSLVEQKPETKVVTDMFTSVLGNIDMIIYSMK